MKRLLLLLLLLVPIIAFSHESKLTWAPVTKYTNGTTISVPVGYEVWRATGSASAGYAKVGDTTSVTFFDPLIVPGKWYYYYVKSYTLGTNNTKTFSARSSIISVKA